MTAKNLAEWRAEAIRLLDSGKVLGLK